MVKESNPGYAGGIGKRSRARQLSYALKGAPVRKKDLRLNAVAAIAEGRKLRDRISGLLKEAGADPGDGMVFACFAEPDLSKPVPKIAEMGLENGASDLALVQQFVNKLPIGFLIFVRDTLDEKQPIYGHARPLLVEDPRALDYIARLLEAKTRQIHTHLMKIGMIPDTRS